ncbi:hypothetical protein D0N36_12075 [Hymenobacter lapidiphilus]|nr:hypothetical protein D0N36_12075 [Hymenobacter sp. CCM 8763]
MKLKSLRHAAWFFGGLCALATASCASEKDPAPDFVGVRYVQTQCADRWGQAPGTQELVIVAQAYLSQQGLTLHQPQASGQSMDVVCSACTCPTGRVLQGKVSPADLSSVLALGFTRQ